MKGRLRIVAGAARGRQLSVPRGRKVRPTPDRVREALFSILGARVQGARVADLCAGSGALGLEALSRGARSVLLIERDREVLETLRENLRRVGLEGATVEAGDAGRVLKRLEGEPFDLVLIDPPFRLELAASLAEQVLGRGLLAPQGVVVIEHPTASDAPQPSGLRLTDQRRYGSVTLTFYESEATAVSDPGQSKGGLAIYPGSFDPITNGHLELIDRGLRVFDQLVVAVAHNPRKTPLFTTDERVTMIREAFPDEPEGLEVDSFEGLLVEYARSRGASVILRGLRAVADFEYELQMANMNKKLEPGVETLFMMTGERYFFLSSQSVREVATLGGPVGNLVPPNVDRALKEKLDPRR